MAKIHHHRGGDFGFGINITSHIENLWANLKYQIKNIYNKMPVHNFIYFFRESEFRLIIVNKNTESKLKYFKKIKKLVNEINGYDFYLEDELYDLKNYGF